MSTHGAQWRRHCVFLTRDARHETSKRRKTTRQEGSNLFDCGQRSFQVCLVIKPPVLHRILQDGYRVEAFGEAFVAFRVARRTEMAREGIRAHELFRGGGNRVVHGENVARIAGFIRETCADVCVAGDSLGEVYAVVIGH